MSESRPPLLPSQTVHPSAAVEQTWSSRIVDRIFRIAEAATTSLDSRLNIGTRQAQQDPVRSSSGSLPQAQPVSPPQSSANSPDDHQGQTFLREDGGQPDTEPGPETAAAAAERHRISDGSIVDIQALVSWIECNVLFALVLLNLFISLHWTGVAIFASMTLIIAVLNRFIRQQIGLKEGRQKVLIAAAAIFTVGHATTVASPSKLILSWQRLSLLPSKSQESAYSSLLVLLFSKASPEDKFLQRSRVLNAAEHISMCLRILITTPFWFLYFQTSTEYTFFLYTGVYLCLKIRLLTERAKHAFKAVQACWANTGSPYGTYLSTDSLLEEGQRAACPICQETLNTPLQLSCKHIFCDSCICEWLEREPTCPMCRARIKAPSMTFKDGAVSLLPQIF